MGRLLGQVLKEMHKSLDALEKANCKMIDALELAVNKAEANEVKFIYYPFKGDSEIRSIKKDGEDYVVYDESGEPTSTLEDSPSNDLYDMIIGAQLYDEEHNEG